LINLNIIFGSSWFYVCGFKSRK